MPDWIVHVIDDAGEGVSGAEVSLVRESEIVKATIDAGIVPRKGTSGANLPTLADGNSGFYRLVSELKSPEGDWRLIVRKHGKSLVVQPFKIAASSKGGFATLPRNLAPKGADLEAASVEIKTTHPSGDSRTTFKVRLQPASEIVLVTGTQYSNPGEPLRTFAEGRRDLLAGDKVPADRRVDDGTIVTLWSLDDRRTLFFVKAKGTTLQWLLVHEVKKTGTPAKPVVPGAPWPDKPDRNTRAIAIHPDDVYLYLSNIGGDMAQRGRVREVSIFSHAFGDGPILYNTFDRTGSGILTRDADDYDCRTKDWDSSQLAFHIHVDQAMAKTGRWHIWGCNSNPDLVGATGAANASRSQGKSETELFAVNVKTSKRRYEASVDRLSVRHRHLQWLRATTEPRSYPGMLVAALKCDVFAALPGTWSNFGKSSRTMFVDLDTGGQSWTIIEAYHKAEPGLKGLFKPTSGIDGTRYVNYKPYTSLAMPTLAPRSDEYELWDFGSGSDARCIVRFRGGKTFPKEGHSTATVTAMSDVGSIVASLAGKPGHHYLLKSTPDTQSAGLIAAVDGGALRVFILTRGATGKFDRQDAELL
jgi:hypothetical protein